MFKLDSNGDLVIDKVECRTIPAFKYLMHRDKGGKIVGDNIGRKKYYAFAELLYVYLVHSPLSLYRDLNDKARKEKARNHVADSLGPDWKPDSKVKEAEKVFIEGLELSGTYKAFIAASRAIYSIGEDIDLFNEQKIKLRKRLIVVQTKMTTTTDKTEINELIEQENVITNRIMSVVANIQKLTSNLTDSYKTLEELKKRVAEEANANKEEIRGGGSLGNREDL